MTLSIPTPQQQPASRDWHGKPERTRVYRWQVPASAAGRYVTLKPKDGETLYLQLRVGHSTSGKAFYAIVGEVIDTGNGCTVSSPLDDVRLIDKPVARYSEKALDAWALTVLADLPTLIGDRPKAAALFAPFEAPQAEEVTPQRLDREAAAEAHANSLPLPGTYPLPACTPEERADQGEDPALAITYVTMPGSQAHVYPGCTCGGLTSEAFVLRESAEYVAARHLAEKHADALARYTAVLTGDLSVLQPDFVC